MCHEPTIFPVVVREIPQIVGVGVCRLEVLEVDGQAGVDRMAPQVNDPRTGQGCVYQPEKQEVRRQLVDHPQRIGRQLPQCLKVAIAQVGQRGVAGFHCRWKRRHR